jgi:hypothetical protein
MTEANSTRLVSKLTRMRGAALKVGQFLSIQSICNHLLHEPPLTHTWQIYMCLRRDPDRVFCRVQDGAHYIPNWQRCVLHLQSTRELTLFGTPERNGFFPRTIVAFLVHIFQPYSFCRCLDRAGPPCHTCTTCLANRAGGARRGENPVPTHSGERDERPELHPHTPNCETTAPTWAGPGQDACCTPRPVILHSKRVKLTIN